MLGADSIFLLNNVPIQKIVRRKFEEIVDDLEFSSSFPSALDEKENH